jgi:hypothetical protein
MTRHDNPRPVMTFFRRLSKVPFMPASPRRFFLASLITVALAVSARAQTPPPDAIPATLDVITFNVHTDGEDHKLIVTPTPDLLRVDAPRDGFSIIYRPQTQYYIGLENRNYTYWEFSWPQVRTAVESSSRYETRLQEVGVESLAPSPTPDPSLPGGGVVAPTLDTNVPPTPPPPSDDDSGYAWHPTTDKKRIAGIDALRWTGDSLSGGPVEVWCYSGPLPKVQNALAQLRAINEPIALVPVRNLVPSFVFEVNDALSKGGVTPLLISWGDDADKNRFELLSLKSREGKPSLFAVPKLYVKTTLVTMDGIGNQKPPEAIQPIKPALHPHLP